MSRNISVSVDDMADTIMQGLKEYADLADTVMKETVNTVSKQVRNEIKKTAPKKTGDYKKKWTIKKVTDKAHVTLNIIHCRSPEYTLAHLLEFGHAKRNGGRVAAIPHIRPAEQHGIETLKKDIERALSK